jgi:predicted ATPase
MPCRLAAGNAMTEATTVPASTTFGEMLRHLRRRARLTQRELGIAVGYSEAHIARLESNQRTPDPAVVSGQFVEGLRLNDQPEAAERLIELAEAARGTAKLQAPVEAHGPPTNLRVQLTSFVGRESEIADVKRLLSATRLLTITGPGGVGKTRLAVQAATDLLPTFEHGVFIVPLASVNDGGLAPGSLAAALGLPSEGVSIESLRDALHERHIMLALDTCEHLIDACAALAIRLVQSCPRLTLMATSREALNVPGEVTWQLPPMRGEEAMQLFVERAKTIRSDFSLTAQDEALLVQICQQLDGLPLAIELAASRLRVLSLEQIAARLDDRFGLLTGSNRLAPLKGQTLRTMIDWSYDLLSDAERRLLRRLSIFTADWTLELAEAICAWEEGSGGAEEQGRRGEEESEIQRASIRREDVLDLLTQLVNKSLVVVDEHAIPPRYSLSNTIRQYAHEKLAEAGEFDEVYRRYLQYLPWLTQKAESAARTSKKPKRKSKRRVCST